MSRREDGRGGNKLVLARLIAQQPATPNAFAVVCRRALALADALVEDSQKLSSMPLP